VRRVALVLIVLGGLAAVPSTSQAADPGRWLLTGWSSVPTDYWQGMAADRSGRVFFSGFFEGLWRTNDSLRRTAAAPDAIPAGVEATEGYNHIGDIAWQASEGGRVVLPFECYVPGSGPGTGNTCGTGSFGIADPQTLALRYYVKLDPAEIPKAMWVASSPDGRLLWTSSGADLLAYRSSDVTSAHAAPASPPIRAIRRLAGAVPPSGVTGGTFVRGRLLLAGSQGTTYQVWSIDTRTGARRLEVELPGVAGESEGLDTVNLLDGELQWLIAPGEPNPTFGRLVAVLHFASAAGQPGLSVTVRSSTRGTATIVAARVTRRGGPVAGALVRFAGARARTNRRGRARLRTSVAGTYRVLARRGLLRGLSEPVAVAGG
jgi:hypothetical protein